MGFEIERDRRAESRQLVGAVLDEPSEVLAELALPLGEDHVGGTQPLLDQVAQGLQMDGLVLAALVQAPLARQPFPGDVDHLLCQVAQGVAPEARRRAGRVAAGLDYDWPNRDPEDDTATRTTLGTIRNACRRLNEDIEASYFNYEIEDSPR